MSNVSGTDITPRRRGANRGPLLLLIGTPGTGKRPLGSYLERERGFTHLNFENPETRERYLAAGTAALRTRIDGLRAGDRGVVITWAAGDTEQLRDVRRLVSQGAAAVWCDSDRGAACRAHYVGARRVPRFDFVDTFETDGSFRPVEAVVGELLARRPRRRIRQRPPPRIRVAGDLRFRLVAAASAVAGAAAVTAVVLTGGSSSATGAWRASGSAIRGPR